MEVRNICLFVCSYTVANTGILKWDTNSGMTIIEHDYQTKHWPNYTTLLSAEDAYPLY